jgi:predicted NBD/HSP70 family sugar kinase
MGDITMKGLCGLAEAGDPSALAVMDRQGYYLGLGLANLVTTFCPDTIALGGGVMESSRFFLERARQVIRQCCTLGADTALAGAAQVWHHRFGSERKAHAI